MADIPVFGVPVSGTNPSADIDINSITVGSGSAANPSVVIGSNGKGFYQVSATTMGYALGGGLKVRFQINNIDNNAVNGWSLKLGTGATSTVPVYMINNDEDTGIGWAGADQLSLIAGGVEGVRFIENGGVLQLTQITAGITADTGSSQGDGPLTSSNNEISVCANVGDAVTLPSASAGIKVTIINNGANACDVFPASSDNAGGGVDTAVSLAAGDNITYFAYDATNWVALT